MRRAVLVSAIVVLLVPAGLARANGDPASDVLLGQDVFFPYAPPPSNGTARAVLELTRRTRAQGWPVKVAIIATPGDLGDVPGMFGRPQRYADFLAAELGGPRLLVVMPSGFGGHRLGDAAARALGPVPSVAVGGDTLALEALRAVARLAARGGHPVDVPPVDRSEAGRLPYREDASLHQGPRAASSAPARAARAGGGMSPLLYAGPAALIVAALIALALRDRRLRRE